MGCHPVLNENATFLTNALRVNLSTVNLRPDAATSGFEI